MIIFTRPLSSKTRRGWKEAIRQSDRFSQWLLDAAIDAAAFFEESPEYKSERWGEWAEQQPSKSSRAKIEPQSESESYSDAEEEEERK